MNRRFLSQRDLCLSLADLFVRAGLLSTICHPLFLYTDRIYSPGPSGLFMPQTFRVQTSLSTSGPFLLHALPAQFVLCYKKRTLHTIKGHLSGRPFLHNVRVYSRRIQTDVIHSRNLSGSVLIVRRRLFSIIRRPLLANPFLSQGPFRPQSWTSSSRALSVLILDEPGTTIIFDQYVRTFLPTSDTDEPLPNGRGHFSFKRTFPHTVRISS